jgi:pilus assembly protein CpaB
MRMLRIILSRINKMWLLMGAAIVLGLLATWVTTQYLKKREASIEAEAKKRASGGTTVEVVVPRRNLPKGTVVDANSMAAREVVADTIYEETILASDFGKVQGTKLVRPVEGGRPLRRTDLDIRAKEFAEALPNGKRAITIEIDEINSIAQMVRVGNNLDLMLIVSDASEGGSGQQQVLMLLPKAKIIATGPIITRIPPAEGPQPAAQRYSNVTFEVTPEEAARIALAQTMGKIRAVLRGDEDQAIEPFAKVTTQTVLRGFSPTKKKRGGDVDGEDVIVEYIIGGRSSGSGVAPVQNISVNMPGMAAAPAAPAVPAGAIPGPTPGQMTVPGVGSFPYPSVPGVNAPAPASAK